MIGRFLSAAIAGAISTMMLCGVSARTANAGEITVLYVGSLRSTVRELIPAFEKSSGSTVKSEAGAAGEMVDRIRAGESADVGIVTTTQIEKLVAQGKMAPGTEVRIGRSGMGLGTPKGAPKLNLSSLDSFKRTLSDTKSIGITDPASGASSAIYAAELLARVDTEGDLRPKIKIFASNAMLFDAVAKGDVTLAFGQIPEIAAAPGVDFAGPLPAEVQNYSHYSAAIPATAKEPGAAKAFIAFLTSPAAAAIMRAKGIDPS